MEKDKKTNIILENIDMIEKVENIHVVNMNNDIRKTDFDGENTKENAIMELLNFNNTKLIGSGAEANVFDTGNGKVVKISKNPMLITAHLDECIKHENDIISHINGDNFTIPNNVIIFKGKYDFHIVEIMEKREIDLKNSNILLLPTILQLIKSVSNMHCNGIYHNDIHSGNFLLNENNEMTISDFGYSKLDSNHNYDVNHLFSRALAQLLKPDFKYLNKIISKDILDNEENLEHIKYVENELKNLKTSSSEYKLKENFYKIITYMKENFKKTDGTKITADDFILTNKEQNDIINSLDENNKEAQLKLIDFKNKMLYLLCFFTEDTLSATRNSIKNNIDKSLKLGVLEQDVKKSSQILYKKVSRKNEVDFLNNALSKLTKEESLTEEANFCLECLSKYIDSDKPIDENFFKKFYEIDKNSKEFTIVINTLIEVNKFKCAMRIKELEEKNKTLEDTENTKAFNKTDRKNPNKNLEKNDNKLEILLDEQKEYLDLLNNMDELIHFSMNPDILKYIHNNKSIK